MKKIDDWICTDPDNFQYGKQHSDFIFEFKEWDKITYPLKNYSKEFVISSFNNDEFWIEIFINLNDYNIKTLDDIANAYGYSLFGDPNLTEWILAECIFEQESGLY